jgi:hypothetical protein
MSSNARIARIQQHEVRDLQTPLRYAFDCEKYHRAIARLKDTRPELAKDNSIAVALPIDDLNNDGDYYRQETARATEPLVDTTSGLANEDSIAVDNDESAIMPAEDEGLELRIPTGYTFRKGVYCRPKGVPLKYSKRKKRKRLFCHRIGV